MSVLIKGMKMPTSCSECALNYDCFKCIVTGTPFFDHEQNFDDETTRLDNCPLVEVPPHGRLIEKNAVFELIRSFPNVDRQLPVEFMKALYELPTIIEAEEDE